MPFQVVCGEYLVNFGIKLLHGILDQLQYSKFEMQIPECGLFLHVQLCHHARELFGFDQIV